MGGWPVSKIRLRAHEQARRPALTEEPLTFLLFPSSPSPGLFTEDDQIRRSEIPPRDLDPQALDAVPAVAQAGRIRQSKRESLDHGVGLDRVACRPGNLGHDRALRTQQRVEERGLARAGPPGDDPEGAFAQPP